MLDLLFLRPERARATGRGRRSSSKVVSPVMSLGHANRAGGERQAEDIEYMIGAANGVGERLS
jgi:hypothetical protein